MADITNRDYDNMSRDQLVEIIGTDVDPNTSHKELVDMARQRDSDMGLNAA